MGFFTKIPKFTSHGYIKGIHLEGVKCNLFIKSYFKVPSFCLIPKSSLKVSVFAKRNNQ